MAISFRGSMRAAPAALVPAIEIPLLIWTRDEYYDLHPVEALAQSPTISRASADPFISDAFASTILILSILIGIAVVFIAKAALTSIENVLIDAGKAKKTARTMLILAVVAQAVGTLGMLVTAYIHLGVDRETHMVSSYFFFFGQTLAIVFCGVFSNILRTHSSAGGTSLFPGALLPALHKVRTSAALAISAGAVIYLILFLVRKVPLPIDGQTVQYVYTLWEIILLAAFVLFLALFAPDLYRAGKEGQAGNPASIGRLEKANL